jgi:RNA polymerase sigma factor (sigma-70 family)
MARAGPQVVRDSCLWYSRKRGPVAAAVVPARVDSDTEVRFHRGEREAFLSVYETHERAVRRLVGRFFARPFERDEAVQEVWLHVHRMAGTFDPSRGALAPWLYAVAANRCKELLRARGRRPDPDVELADERVDASAGAGPEDAARTARARAAVTRFEASLTSEEAIVFRLSLIEERSHDEVARAAGISARRCKYLRMKLLVRAAADPTLRAALAEVTEP